MVTYKFNKPYYELHFSNLEDESVNVLSFEGEEKISDLFRFRIKIISENPALDTSKILNNNATYLLNRGEEEPIKIHGIISHIEQYGRTNEYVFYEVILVPRLWRLSLVFQNEVYQNMEIKDVINSVLTDAGLSGSDYKVDLKSSYPKSEYIVQYNETNLEFLHRRLEHYGIFYYFDHNNDKDVVVFTDINSKLPDIRTSEAIGYNLNKDPLSETESISEIQCREKVVTGMVQLKDYNYMFPEKQLMAQSQIESTHPGLYYSFGDNFQNEKEAEFLAKVRNQEFLCQSKIFSGITDSRLFRAGARFKMEKHYRDDWNSEYIITKSFHRGTQKSLFAFLPEQKKYEPTFECRFEAIPFEIDFRPLRKTPFPKISGIMSAKIESGSGDEYAYIDDHGRYRAKMLFDLSDKSNGEATMPIRLTQNYSGEGYGVHFPNHANTELLWACVDGNPDRPIGLGTVPNPSQATPVASKNKTQNIIRTAAGNELIMDDKSKESQIILSTPDANKLIFDDKDDKIEVISKDKHKVTMDDKNQNIEVKSKDGHKILMDDKNTKIEVVSKEGHFITINDKSGEEKIQISDKEKKNTFILDIKNNKLVIETKEGGIEILAPKGEISIKSKTFKLETEGDTSFKAGNIKVEAKQDYKLNASGITQEAKMDLKLTGMNLEAKGNMNTKVEAGIGIEIKGGATAKLSGGAKTDVECSGMTSVKGSLVMIN
ncbi:MAG TPA: type VI secretion system tip protein TssI/VgrG [Ignavibacteriaceae bacterium]|nr:type VI secretion system tip protein TssI/VgrG [Ignavibacteriaceae bacterium]